jgi:hypothetical protein
MKFTPLVPLFHFLKRKKSNVTNNGKAYHMNENKKYFLNPLRCATSKSAPAGRQLRVAAKRYVKAWPIL